MEEFDWKEKKKEDSLLKGECYKGLTSEQVVKIGGRYAKVLPRVLKSNEISAGAKYMYTWLLMFKRFDKKRAHCGKAVVSNRLLIRESGMGKGTIVKRRLELEEAGFIKSDSYKDIDGCVYTFLVIPSENEYCERVTRNFMYCDTLKSAQKQFIVSLIPYIYDEVDRFGYSNEELANKMGYSVKQVRNHMNTFKEIGLLVEYEKRRGFDLIKVMSGMADKIDVLLAEVEEKDHRIEELEHENEMLRQVQKIEQIDDEKTRKCDASIDSSKHEDESAITKEDLNESIPRPAPISDGGLQKLITARDRWIAKSEKVERERKEKWSKMFS